jgi:T-complex protein 1 subunit gamma
LIVFGHLLITELPDLAQHFLMKANITALRRVRKTDNNRIARASGATIVNRVDDIQESDIGTGCGLFEIEKIGDEYFTFMRKCKSPKACTILLRGPSKDILNEVERNLQDAMAVARNVIFHPRLSPGGGAVEMAVSVKLSQLARSVEGVQQWPYKAVADAMEVIPRTLAQNAGASPIRVLTQLRAKHVEGHTTWGLDGDSGKLVDMREYGVWEPEAVKLQSIKTAVEVSYLRSHTDCNPLTSYPHLVRMFASPRRRYLQWQVRPTARQRRRWRRGIIDRRKRKMILGLEVRT